MESLETALFLKVLLEVCRNCTGDSAEYLGQSVFATVCLHCTISRDQCCSYKTSTSLRHRVLLLLQWLLSHTIIAVLALPSPRGDSTKFSGLNRAFCSYWMLCFSSKHCRSTLQDSKYLYCHVREKAKHATKNTWPASLRAKWQELRRPGYTQSSLTKLVWLVENPKQESSCEPFLPRSFHWFKLAPTGFILPWTDGCSSPGTLCLK